MHMASHPLKALAVSATLLALAAPAARAQEARAAIGEAAAVHALATAARLCNLISEPELTRALSRMDRVHASQLSPRDQETYLKIMDDFLAKPISFATLTAVLAFRLL